MIPNSAGETSYIQNVEFDAIKTNAISFGGFSGDNTAEFIILNTNVKNCVFDSPDSLMTTQKYSYTGDSTFIIRTCEFTDLTFDKFGNIFSFNHNSATKVTLDDILFETIYGAGIRLEPQDIFDTSNPLYLVIENSFFRNNVPFVSAFIDVYENSLLDINTCEFENIFSIGSGSVLLANYKENTIAITDSTFMNNYSILGGVFYAQFASKISCTRCTFENNVAIRGGVAFLNSNGLLHLTNSSVENNMALNAPVAYISACNADYSILDEVTITDNILITMEELIASDIPRTETLDSRFIDQVTTNQEFYEKSVSGSKMSMVSMIKGKIQIINGS